MLDVVWESVLPPFWHVPLHEEDGRLPFDEFGRPAGAPARELSVGKCCQYYIRIRYGVRTPLLTPGPLTKERLCCSQPDPPPEPRGPALSKRNLGHTVRGFRLYCTSLCSHDEAHDRRRSTVPSIRSNIAAKNARADRLHGSRIEHSRFPTPPDPELRRARTLRRRSHSQVAPPAPAGLCGPSSARRGRSIRLEP